MYQTNLLLDISIAIICDQIQIWKEHKIQTIMDVLKCCMYFWSKALNVVQNFSFVDNLESTYKFFPNISFYT